MTEQIIILGSLLTSLFLLLITVKSMYFDDCFLLKIALQIVLKLMIKIPFIVCFKLVKLIFSLIRLAIEGLAEILFSVFESLDEAGDRFVFWWTWLEGLRTGGGHFYYTVQKIYELREFYKR